MKLSKVISLIQNNYVGFWHENVVRQALAMAYDIFLNEESDLTPFRVQYEGVSIQESNGKYFSTLPVSTANVDDPVVINLTDQFGIIFTQMTEEEANIYNELDVSLISDAIGFIVRPNRVDYRMTDSMPEYVDMWIVPDLSDVDVNTDIRLPLGSAELLVETALNFLSKKKPFTEINDGNEMT